MISRYRNIEQETSSRNATSKAPRKKSKAEAAVNVRKKIEDN